MLPTQYQLVQTKEVCFNIQHWILFLDRVTLREKRLTINVSPPHSSTHLFPHRSPPSAFIQLFTVILSSLSLLCTATLNTHCSISYSSEHVVHLVSGVGVLGVVGDPGVEGHHGVLGADVKRVVDLPVDVADLAGGVEQALE